MIPLKLGVTAFGGDSSAGRMTWGQSRFPTSSKSSRPSEKSHKFKREIVQVQTKWLLYEIMPGSALLKRSSTKIEISNYMVQMWGQSKCSRVTRVTESDRLHRRQWS